MQNLLRALKIGDNYPSQVRFDEYLSAWFRSLWGLSLVQPMKEHGAALVEVNGRLAVAAARSGSYIAFPLKDEEMRASGFLGYFHTHPYEDATMGVAFSPGDLRITISRKMKICVVQSGEDLFMVAQTPDTPEQIAVDEITESEFNDRVAFYQRLGQSWQEAVFQTNLHLCREYGFAFYAGKLCQPLERR